MTPENDANPIARKPLARRWKIGVPRLRLRWFAGTTALAAIYFASAKLGLSLAFVAEQVSAVWPSSGIALAAVLLFGYRAWPGIALGAFMANVTSNEPLLTACGIAAGNTLEAVLAAWLLKRVAGFDNALERMRDAFGLILLAAGLSTMASATIGVVSLCVGQVYLPALDRTIQWSDFGGLWWTWWLGDAIGTLVVAPVLLTWASRRSPLPWHRPAEAVALLAGLFATSWVAYLAGFTSGFGGASLAYIVFPFIIWAALRFGQPGTTAVTLVAASIIIWATLNHFGPFSEGPFHERLLLMQVFMGVVAVTALVLGAALAERRRVEAELRHSEEGLRSVVEELQTLVNILPVGIFIAKDPECKMITTNPAGAAMLQIPAETDASKTGPGADKLDFRVMKKGKDVASEDLPMQWAARTGLSVSGEEFEIIREDGTSITLYEYASPLFDALGKVRGCLGVFVDITALKRAEEALREGDRRKDEFLATLAHELRNPLAPIRGGVDFLRLSERHDDETRGILEMLDRQVQQITRLVDDLLDVSRVTRGKIRLQRGPVELEGILTQALEMSRPLCDAHGHELAVSLPSQPIQLEADATRLTQVFTNLLNNAAKFSPRGSRITLTAAQEGETAIVRVGDTGQGIDAETLPHVFDLFVQGDRSLTRLEGGLGIGLTLVHRLVEMHGGSVQAASEGLGKGSEFVVRLPTISIGESPIADPPQPLQSGSENSNSGWRILVVDDNVDAARSLELLLRGGGDLVRVVHSGLAAVELAKSDQPDVVLLDIGLPDIDGYEVARQIRSVPHGCDTILIAVTGWGQAADRQRAVEAGFNHHLTKPVEHAVLRNLLAELRSAAQPAAGPSESF
jgi:signal transduction histidine kinase/integral membrane sensor domain MASE1/CheY-like chemotaxis protein